ncbi:terminase [Candidatus Pacearchaeota archaeon]|nr:terminase [Candidatus Pacearchaeota archaeon]
MARPRKPTHLHVVSGSAKTNPGRLADREAEPVADDDIRGIEAPDYLDEGLAAIWREVAGMLHARVASNPDMIALEALVRLVARMRTGEMSAADYARLQGYLGEFGMTPASRSKVSQGKKAVEKKGFAALKGAG